MTFKTALFFLTGLSIVSCQVSKEPEFIRIGESRIVTLNKDAVKISSNAHFFNPNDIGCEIVATNIDVDINGISVGDVQQTGVIELEANQNFAIPLSINFPPSAFIKDKLGLISIALGSITNKMIEVQYSGTVTLSKLGIEFDVEVEGEEEIPFKKQ